jgi:hypothetical protein
MSGDEFKGTPEGLPNNDISTPVPPKRGKKLSGGEAPRARKTKRAEEPAKPQAEYAPSPEEADSSGPDPFDPKQFRAGSQTAASIAQRVWTDGQILIRKPNDQEWFRVRPGDDWKLMASILQRRADGKYRLLDPAIAPAVRQAKVMTLHCGITIEGNPFLWPIAEPLPDGKDYAYWETARGIAVEAEAHWIRVWANQSAGCYNSERAPKDYGEGKWETAPSTFRDWLRIGFGKDGVVRDLEHPDLKKLRGEL